MVTIIMLSGLTMMPANNRTIAVGIESDDNINEEKITVVLEGDDKERIVFLYTSGEDEEGSL